MTPTRLLVTAGAALAALPGWQALLVTLGASILAAAGIQILGDRAIKRLTARIEGEVDDVVLAALHPAIYVSVILTGVYIARDALPLGDGLLFGLEASVLSLLTVLWGFTLVRVGRDVSRVLTADATRDATVVPIFQNGWTALVLGVGAFLLLSIWSVDVTPLLASAGIIGIIVGFAAKDTIANLFGSVALFFDGTYAVGDYIVLDSGERGRVEDISIRSTVIRTRDDVRVTVPNAKLNSAVVINESSPSSRYRVRTRVGVAYGSDLDAVEAALRAVADGVDGVLAAPAPRVRFRGFGESSLDVELLCWIRDPAGRGRTTHALTRGIYERFAADGIRIPFPQRELHVGSGDPVGASIGVPGTADG